MGFYDCRCMVSGLSLGASKAVLVLLEKVQDGYVPISLPVLGQYNRLGSIDMIAETENGRAILDFFLRKIDSGEVAVDWEEVYWDGKNLKRIVNVEQLFACVERGVTMEYDCVTLNGRRIEFSLIDARIWDAVVGFERGAGVVDHGRAATWNLIYEKPFPEYTALLDSFLNAEAFMDQQGIVWRPSTDSSQHYYDDVEEFLAAAKVKFKDVPLVMGGILEYEATLED